MTTAHNTSPASITTMITDRQAELGKTDEQLAQELSFDRATTISMIKQGAVKLPLQKVAALATALSIPPATILRQLLAETMPEVLTAVETMLVPVSLSPNEAKLIDTFRHLCKGQDVAPVVVEGNAIVALMVA